MNTPLYYGSVGIFGAPHLPRRGWLRRGIGSLARLRLSRVKWAKSSGERGSLRHARAAAAAGDRRLDAGDRRLDAGDRRPGATAPANSPATAPASA